MNYLLPIGVGFAIGSLFIQDVMALISFSIGLTLIGFRFWFWLSE